MAVEPQKEERLTRGRNRLSGRRRQSRRHVDIAGPTACRYRRADDTIAGPTKARMRFGGLKSLEEAGGRPEEVSVGLVRRRAARRSGKGGTGIGGISRTVVGRAVGQGCRAGRARRRHTGVRSSYHLRVRTKLFPNFAPTDHGYAHFSSF
ncbi:hypothetical protein PPACK8108_LOCUS7916 [Phakopsora pachyrhizi]|uniref:Uncharacterized protein n=1 Tax=Phakopsora pachyrhizi TaxID=170000 RepID=A0AAV0ATS7_PHAPC|nr:hypothetical protein PPACK8108_LOCUS7916 [Phakopsora pachyrhizi]